VIDFGVQQEQTPNHEQNVIGSRRQDDGNKSWDQEVRVEPPATAGILASSCAVAISVVCWTSAVSGSPASQVDAYSSRQAAVSRSAHAAAPRVVLDTYCIGCHNDRLKSAGLSFDRFNLDQVGESAELWKE